MPINKLLPRLQRIVAGRRLRWAHDPQLWVELFVTANLAILAADIYIAHSVNHFQKTAEYIPLYFSIGAPVVLAVMVVLRWIGTLRSSVARCRLFDRLAFCPRWIGRRSLPLGKPVLCRSNTQEPHLCSAVRSAPGVYRTRLSASDESYGWGAQRRVGAMGNLPGVRRLLREFCFVTDRSCVQWILRKHRMDPGHFLRACNRLPDYSARTHRDEAIHGCVSHRDARTGPGWRLGILVSHAGESLRTWPQSFRQTDQWRSSDGPFAIPQPSRLGAGLECGRSCPILRKPIVDGRGWEQPTNGHIPKKNHLPANLYIS